MEKSADAFRTISEVAEDLALPQHVLRFWETRFPQIRPLKRAGGRRYYRPADIVLLRAIRQLLYDEGYTIKGVQRLLKEQGARGLRIGDSRVDLVEEPIGDASEAATVDGVRPEAAVGPAIDRVLGPIDEGSLSEALACIEECERILRTLQRGAG